MSSAPSGPGPDNRGSGSCYAQRTKVRSSRTARSSLFLFVDDAHGAQLRSKDLPHPQEELLIIPGLVVGISPREKLICIVPEVHRDLAEDAAAQIDSVVKVFR